MTFDSIIFDLDGTLWDTCAACAVAWNNVIRRNRITFREITPTDVRRVAGMPHDVCIRETFTGLPERDLQTLITETMTEDNVMVEKLGGEIYEGVGNGLRELASHYRLFIVSNCQSGYIETFLKFSGFWKFIVDFECWGNTNKSKAENLRSVIARNGLKNPVMIGDMESDLIAAQKCEIPFFHMKYGFGEVSACDQAFDSFEDLLRYFSITRRFGGTGLGLALSKKLTEALGGKIRVERSELGQGSTFEVTIAAEPSRNTQSFSEDDLSTTPVSSPATASKTMRLSHMRILLVEDSPGNQVLVSRLLVAQDAVVEFAENGLVGIDKAKGKPYDVVLMDMQMPICGGLEATKRLREKGYGRPIVALTAHAMEDERRKAFAEGCTDSLTKPINKEMLISVLERYGPEFPTR